MYLPTLKAARSAKFFWEEIFMPKSQLGGILYIFPPGFGTGHYGGTVLIFYCYLHFELIVTLLTKHTYDL